MYVIVVFDRKKLDEIVVVKLGSFLVIGIGDDEFFVVSDVIFFIEFINNVIYLEDEEMVIICLGREVCVWKIKSDSLVVFYI